MCLCAFLSGKTIFPQLAGSIGAGGLRAFSGVSQRRGAGPVFRMAPADQRHCLDTAKSALGQEAAKSLDSEEFRLLLRSCLLHDVGKAAGDLGVWSRSIITMLLACSEGLVRRLAAYGANQQAGSFLWACYVHFQHPARGARWLADVGAERELLELVLYHHEDCYPGNNPLLLDILRRCDEMN